MKNKNNHFYRNIRKTWNYIKTSKLEFYIFIILNLIEAVISVIIPIFAAKIILNMTSNLIYQLIISSLYVFSFQFILFIVYYFNGLLFQKIYQKTFINLQFDVAKEMLKLEIKEIDKSSSGLFIDRLNKDTQDISTMITEYTNWISYVLSNIGILLVIFVLNKYLFVFCLLSAIFIYFINKKRLSKQYEIQKKIKKIQENKTGLMGELVRGIKDIKVLNAYQNILNKTSYKIEEASIEEYKMFSIKIAYQFFENNTRNICDFLFILIGCFLYNKNLLTIPVFIIIYNYQYNIKNLLLGVVQLLEINKKFILSSDRVYEIIDNEKYEKEYFGNIDIKEMTGNISFDHVNFKYNDNDIVLNDISFDIKPNETVAFVGKSGSGKTTIFNLIAKLYKINSGNIMIDYNNIEKLSRESIRENISMISQNPYIFDLSIKENLLLANKKATMKDIIHACKMACIDDYINSLPNKYDSMLGENGVILSGGQKQRIAIARILLKKSKIILFDEATSSLDNETQSQIQEAIKNIRKNHTILIVAHRLSTIVDCDRIFVVDNGTIIASGSHLELLKNCKEYRNLYEKDLQSNNL